MGNKFLAADGETENGRGIGTAHNIDLWALRVEMPTQLEEIGKAISVVGMHVCEEHCIDLRRWNIELRQSHRCAAAHIELHFDSTAIVGVVTIAHQRSGAAEAVKFRRSTHGARQRHDHAGGCIGRVPADEDPCSGNKYCRQRELLQVLPPIMNFHPR
jgi:hypothetical protein